MRSLLFALILAGAAAAAPDSKSTTKPSSHIDEPKWQDIVDKTGEIPSAQTVKINFAPRTTKWRFALATSKSDTQPKGNADLTLAKIDLWIEVVTDGKKGLQLVQLKPWKGRAGDTKEINFDNGLWADGSPRKFQIAITGHYIKYEIEIQDLGDGPLVKEKAK